MSPKTSALPFYSTLYGEVIDTAKLNGDYWYNNLREKVLFASSVRRLADDGFRVFIEMSPHPVLTVPVQEMVEDVDDAVVLSSSRRDRDEVEAVVGSLAGLHVRGGSVNFGRPVRGAPTGGSSDVRVPAAAVLVELLAHGGGGGGALDGAARGR